MACLSVTCLRCNRQRQYFEHKRSIGDKGVRASSSGAVAAEAEESQHGQAALKEGEGHQADAWQSLDMATLASLWSPEQIIHVPEDQSPTFLSPVLMNPSGLAEIRMHVNQDQHTSVSIEESSKFAGDCGSVPDEFELHKRDNQPLEDHAKLAETIMSSPDSTAPKATLQISSVPVTDSSYPMSSIQPKAGKDNRRTRQEHQKQIGDFSNVDPIWSTCNKCRHELYWSDAL
eukprot:SM000157S02073  [mRNA]  locus=s157:106170:107023:+ [translate_table: standard]